MTDDGKRDIFSQETETWSNEDPPTSEDIPFAIGYLVAGRYQLNSILGRGGSGHVYLASDQLAGIEVAVKVIADCSRSELVRVRREIATLRHSRMPGVVSLLDEGQESDRYFIVMERVAGSPFPGTSSSRSWQDLRSSVVSLLEIIARVHGAGVIHRDLKPSNVQVDEFQRVTVLDFGLSLGPEMLERVTRSGAAVGTPLYMSPEMLMGKPASETSDLYAIGIMVYEALSGGIPHVTEEYARFVSRRLREPPVPIEEVAKNVPPHVADLVNSMIHPSSASRPQSAVEVLTLLRGEGRSQPPLGLPRLGGTATLDRLVTEAIQGRSVDLYGSSGSGRSRCLSELSEELRDRGIGVVEVQAASKAFSSIGSLLEEPLRDLATRSLAAVRDLFERRLAELLSNGDVVLVDDWGRVDSHSQSVLESARSSGCIVRVLDGCSTDCPTVEPLEVSDLESLFAGTKRIFHIREDAAKVLWDRTRGFPKRIVHELGAWIRAGLARWESGQVVTTRGDIDRLLSGLLVSTHEYSGRQDSTLPPNLQDVLALVHLMHPHADAERIARVNDRPRWEVEADLEVLRDCGAVDVHDGRSFAPRWQMPLAHQWAGADRARVHRTIANALHPGVERRLSHVISGGVFEEVASECCARAEALYGEQGQVGSAIAIVTEGLITVRQSAGRPGEQELLEWLVRMCLASGTAPSLQQARYQLQRSDCSYSARLLDLVEAALLILSGSPEEGFARADEIGEFEDSLMEQARQAVRVVAARQGARDRFSEVIRTSSAWAERTGTDSAQASLATWRGWYLYDAGRWSEAAAEHEKCAQVQKSGMGRLSALLNASSAHLEARQFEEARSLATEAIESARASRHCLSEARAEWILRSIAYRHDETVEVDAELVAAIKQLGSPHLEGLLLLNEAAVAWRAGDLDLGRELAEDSMRRGEMGHRKGFALGLALLSEALAFRCGRPATPERIAELAAEATSYDRDPSVAVQTLGLLAKISQSQQEGLLDEARGIASLIPRDAWGVREGVLSIAEAID